MGAELRLASLAYRMRPEPRAVTILPGIKGLSPLHAISRFGGMLFRAFAICVGFTG